MPTKRANVVHVELAEAGWLLEIEGCPATVDGLPRILAGWGLRTSLSRGSARARIWRRGRKSFGWESPKGVTAPVLWTERPPETETDVLCDIHDVLIDWYLAENPNHLALHGAAAKLGSGLVVFPTLTKTGKSTLMVELARRGVKIFCDDVLALEPKHSHGAALGLMPRLRNPLPRTATPAFRKFVAECRGPTDRRWIYVTLPDRVFAPLGTATPIRSLVFLERKARGAARLEAADAAEMLQELVAQNIAKGIRAGAILSRLAALTAVATSHRLTYSATEDAAKLLIERFAAARRPRARRASNRMSP